MLEPKPSTTNRRYDDARAQFLEYFEKAYDAWLVQNPNIEVSDYKMAFSNELDKGEPVKTIAVMLTYKDAA